MSARKPRVSVVIPMRNEEKYICRCLDSLMRQDYPSSLLEVKVVDGRSEDRSRELVEAYLGGSPAVELLDNPRRITPTALNTGIREASGDIIIILGSHSFVEADFVTRNVEALAATGADCAGGKIETISDSRMGRVVSTAMTSTFGVGNSRFRTSDRPGFVDTVAFGAYRREVFGRIGLFDEELVRNQDDEFNFRLTRSGGKVYLDPSIRSSYYSRSTLAGLWKQYFRYGFWKTRVLRKHGRVPAMRHLVPSAALVVFSLSLASAAVAPPAFWVALTMLGLYLLLSLAFTLRLAVSGGSSLLLLPLAFATLHLSYATGFLSGLPRLIFHRGRWA